MERHTESFYNDLLNLAILKELLRNHHFFLFGKAVWGRRGRRPYLWYAAAADDSELCERRVPAAGPNGKGGS